MTSTVHLLPCPQIFMAEGTRNVPGPEAPVNEKLLFLRENMVHLTNQLSMPIIEVALVISKYIRIVLDSLQKAASEEGEELPEMLLKPIPNKSSQSAEDYGLASFPLEKLIDRVDQDRMDILDTLVRTILNQSQLEFVSALSEFRDWEFEIRNQLSEVSSPGGLFSPLSLDDDF
mgnify:FL=1|tara:strand:- start:1215 stop:1736 length:522 start_codon:yes stop_codon:yes gene_type:complete